MRKWNSVAIAFVTVLALLIPLGGMRERLKGYSSDDSKGGKSGTSFQGYCAKGSK